MSQPFCLAPVPRHPFPHQPAPTGPYSVTVEAYDFQDQPDQPPSSPPPPGINLFCRCMNVPEGYFFNDTQIVKGLEEYMDGIIPTVGTRRDPVHMFYTWFEKWYEDNADSMRRNLYTLTKMLKDFRTSTHPFHIQGNLSYLISYHMKHGVCPPSPQHLTPDRTRQDLFYGIKAWLKFGGDCSRLSQLYLSLKAYRADPKYLDAVSRLAGIYDR